MGKWGPVNRLNDSSFPNWPSQVGPQSLCNRIFLVASLCCLKTLYFSKYIWVLSQDWIRSIPFLFVSLSFIWASVLLYLRSPKCGCNSKIGWLDVFLCMYMYARDTTKEINVTKYWQTIHEPINVVVSLHAWCKLTAIRPSFSTMMWNSGDAPKSLCAFASRSVKLSSSLTFCWLFIDR